MRRTGRKLFRNLRGVGNFYKRKYVFQLTQQPIDLFFAGVSGNNTLLGDFDLSTLGNITQDGNQMLGEIQAIGDLFTYGRVAKARLFWRTSGDKTNARYNLNSANSGANASSGIQAGNIGNATGGVSGDFCGTYPHDSNQSPWYSNTTGTQSGAYVGSEAYQRVVQQRGFKAGSLWAGSRTFKPAVLKQNINTFSVNVTGTQKMAQLTDYKKTYNRWFKTNSPVDNLTILTTAAQDAVLETIRYTGLNLSLPQVGCYGMLPNALGATQVNPTFANGDYFTNVWLEIEVQWKDALSSLSNPNQSTGFQRTQPPNMAAPVRAAVEDAVNTINSFNGPSMAKMGRFTDAADAISSGLGILSRMKRD